jgi:hypothetical protein
MKENNFLTKIFTINNIILIISFGVLIFTFFNKNGILNKIIYYYDNKKKIIDNIKIKEKEINSLKNKLKLLQKRDPEILEIIDFHYKKKIPYKNEKYEIIKI